jgi:hypothetical protein
MLVYRIEDVTGGGIYRGDLSGKNPMTIWSSDRHPAPRNDSLLVSGINGLRSDDEISWCVSDWIQYHDFIFGFASVDQLRSWVHKDRWLWLMQERGFHLAVFDVEDVIVGHTQCIFKRKDVKHTSYFPIADFFDVMVAPPREDDEPEED